MKTAKHAIVIILLGALILAFWFIYSEKLAEQKLTVDKTAIDQLNPESTGRSFWQAIEDNDLNTAAKLVDADKLNQGRYAKKLKTYFETLQKINSKQLHFNTNESRVTVYSDEYNMDYDLEKSKEGKWLIVSIHP
ncbi:MAG: hypothetical protein AAB575_05165 [Patescibacteria group bacterium]